jgi:hypothetical protein
MKNVKFLILFVAFTLLSCERDDICAESTSTTPRLLVEFFDIADNETLKSVTRLTTYSEGLVTDPIEISNATLVFNTNTNGLELPLRIGVEGETTTTRYILEKETNLRLDTSATTESNIDILEITYVSEFVYVSRACGFKSVFTQLRISIIDDGNNWIQSFDFPDTTENNIIVENENATHLQLFH